MFWSFRQNLGKARVLKNLTITALTVLLAGCNATMPMANGPTNDPSTMCYSGLASDQRFAVLAPRIGSVGRPDQASLDMRSSKAYPTDTEKTALKVWYVARQVCQEWGEQYRAANAPMYYRNAFDSQQSRFLDLIAKLSSEQITYGDFISLRETLGTEARTAINAGSQQARSIAAQEQAASAARSAAAAQILQQWQANQPRPPTSINCTTQRLGTTLNTQCN